MRETGEGEREGYASGEEGKFMRGERKGGNGRGEHVGGKRKQDDWKGG